MPDRYSYPDTTVLINKLGITDEGRWKAVEAAAIHQRMVELFLHPIDGDFDLTHLQAIHAYLTQDMYVWGGELRDTDTYLGGTGLTHCRPPFILAEADRMFGALADRDHLRDLDAGAFCDALLRPNVVRLEDVEQGQVAHHPDQPDSFRRRRVSRDPAVLDRALDAARARRHRIPPAGDGCSTLIAACLVPRVPTRTVQDVYSVTRHFVSGRTIMVLVAEVVGVHAIRTILSDHRTVGLRGPVPVPCSTQGIGFSSQRASHLHPTPTTRSVYTPDQHAAQRSTTLSRPPSASPSPLELAHDPPVRSDGSVGSRVGAVVAKHRGASPHQK